MIEYFSKNLHMQDLHLHHCGEEQCAPGHSFGPAVRDCYKIHYIVDGEGVFEANGQRHHLTKGDCFLILPGAVTYYKADDNNPWHYCWVGFDGLSATAILKQANLTADTPILHYSGRTDLYHCIKMMIDSKAMSRGRDVALTGLLYTYLSLLIDNAELVEDQDLARTNKKEQYVTQVMNFIDTNYANPITVESIAEHVGLQRSYLSSLFTESAGTSIQSYLIHHRMRKACELITGSALSMGDIARSVGYDDPLLFSKMFKRVIGTAPTYYRKRSI